MTFSPQETQKITVSTSILMKLVAFGFCAWAGVVGWVGITVIDRVDALAATFNGYVLTMERRVTTLEEAQKAWRR